MKGLEVTILISRCIVQNLSHTVMPCAVLCYKLGPVYGRHTIYNEDEYGMNVVYKHGKVLTMLEERQHCSW